MFTETTKTRDVVKDSTGFRVTTVVVLVVDVDEASVLRDYGVIGDTLHLEISRVLRERDSQEIRVGLGGQTFGSVIREIPEGGKVTVPGRHDLPRTVVGAPESVVSDLLSTVSLSGSLLLSSAGEPVSDHPLYICC